MLKNLRKSKRKCEIQAQIKPKPNQIQPKSSQIEANPTKILVNESQRPSQAKSDRNQAEIKPKSSRKAKPKPSRSQDSD